MVRSDQNAYPKHKHCGLTLQNKKNACPIRMRHPEPPHWKEQFLTIALPIQKQDLSTRDYLLINLQGYRARECYTPMVTRCYLFRIAYQLIRSFSTAIFTAPEQFLSSSDSIPQ